MKKKHADSCVAIDDYKLFRRDRVGRKCGGVAIYLRRAMTAAVYLPPIDGDDEATQNYEMLWVKVNHGSDVTFVGALYHPPKPLYGTNDLLDYIEASVVRIQQDFPAAHLMLAGDLNQISDNEVVIRTGLTSLVTLPTRYNNILDSLYVSDFEYTGVKVVQSVATSDHKAIVAYSGGTKYTVGKYRGMSILSVNTPRRSMLAF